MTINNVPVLGTYTKNYQIADFDGDKTVGDDGTLTITKDIDNLQTYVNLVGGVENVIFSYSLSAIDAAVNEATGNADNQAITPTRSMRIGVSDVLSSTDSLDDLLANVGNSSNQNDTQGATRVAADSANYDIIYNSSDINILLDDAIASNSNLI